MRIILIVALSLLPISAFAANTTQHTGKKAPVHHPVTGKKLQNSAKPAAQTPAAKPEAPAAKY